LRDWSRNIAITERDEGVGDDGGLWRRGAIFRMGVGNPPEMGDILSKNGGARQYNEHRRKRNHLGHSCGEYGDRSDLHPLGAHEKRFSPSLIIRSQCSV